jgi:hypothetical protein
MMKNNNLFEYAIYVAIIGGLAISGYFVGNRFNLVPWIGITSGAGSGVLISVAIYLFILKNKTEHLEYY